MRFDSLQHENRSWKEIRSLFWDFGREGAKIGPPAIPEDTTRNTTIAPAFLFRETRADELRNCGEAIAEFKTKFFFFFLHKRQVGLMILTKRDRVGWEEWQKTPFFAQVRREECGRKDCILPLVYTPNWPFPKLRMPRVRERVWGGEERGR